VDSGGLVDRRARTGDDGVQVGAEP